MKKSINLLPPAEQKEIKLLEASREVRDFGIWLVVSLAALAALLFVTRIFLSAELASVAGQQAASAAALENLQGGALRQEIELFNKDLANFKKLEEHETSLAPVLREFGRLLPPDLTLDSLNITRADGKVEVSGRGGTRTSVLRLRQLLLDSEYFENVNFPLANLERAGDTPWKYRFYIKSQ